MTEQVTDVAVVGAGPGGYVAAIRAAQLGMSATIIEPDEMGGLCLNWGCIPSKALLRSAEVLSVIQGAGEFGITVGEIEADFGVAVKRSRRVVNRLVKGVESLLKKNKVTVVRERGVLNGSGSISVGADSVRATKGIILATGAADRVVPGLEPDGEFVMTSRHALERPDIPGRVLIVGGGATGAEFAYLYRTYGSEVTLVEMLPQLLPNEDEDVAAELESAFTKQGISVLTGARVESVDRNKRAAVIQAEDSRTEAEFDLILVAVGMKGREDDLGFEAAGVRTTEAGFAQIGERMETSGDGVYAIGDLTGPPLLAHVAMAQGVIAAETIAGKPTHGLVYEDMPRAVYCHPQVASIGLTQKEAETRGRSVTVGRFPFRASGKALSLGDTVGFVKIVKDSATSELLGAQMIGPECTELLGELSVARMLESTPLEVGRAVHPHPTLSEVLMEAALSAEGEAIHI